MSNDMALQQAKRCRLPAVSTDLNRLTFGLEAAETRLLEATDKVGCTSLAEFRHLDAKVHPSWAQVALELGSLQVSFPAVYYSLAKSVQRLATSLQVECAEAAADVQKWCNYGPLSPLYCHTLVVNELTAFGYDPSPEDNHTWP